jgi:hypothetical protein
MDRSHLTQNLKEWQNIVSTVVNFGLDKIREYIC